jgi:hypothetical protein
VSVRSAIITLAGLQRRHESSAWESALGFERLTMKHHWRIPIWVLVLTSSFCVGLTMAQNQVFPSCAQTLKQNPEAFLKSLSADVGQEAVAGYHWAKCKRQQNAQRLRGFPKLALRLKRLAALEENFVSAQNTMASLKTGDGLGLVSDARVVPRIELHLETLIRLTTTKAGAVTNTAMRKRYVQAKLELESRIARVITTPRLYREPGPNPDMAVGILDFPLQLWKRKALEYQQAYRQILDLIGSQQNAASLEVLEFLNTSLSANEL